MNFLVRDYQARVNAISNAPVLKIDGLNGPKTRKGISEAMEMRNVNKQHLLFNESGLHRIVWHWTASPYEITTYVLSHYNDVHDYLGNSYDGGQRAEAQARYNYRLGVGVSHCKNNNTGVIGQAVAGMHGAREHPFTSGSSPMTWAGIDAMLMRSIDYHYNFDIPVTEWSMTSHSEVQERFGIKQSGKWDINWLPDMDKPVTAKVAGDILRNRMIKLMEL